MQDLTARVEHLEAELQRLRRSRRVLMDLLVALDRRWRTRVAVLEAENRRLRKRVAGAIHRRGNA